MLISPGPTLASQPASLASSQALLPPAAAAPFHQLAGHSKQACGCLAARSPPICFRINVATQRNTLPNRLAVAPNLFFAYTLHSSLIGLQGRPTPDSSEAGQAPGLGGLPAHPPACCHAPARAHLAFVLTAFSLRLILASVAPVSAARRPPLCSIVSVLVYHPRNTQHSTPWVGRRACHSPLPAPPSLVLLFHCALCAPANRLVALHNMGSSGFCM